MSQENQHRKGLKMPNGYLSQAKQEIDQRLDNSSLSTPKGYFDDAKAAIDAQLSPRPASRWKWLAVAASIILLAGAWWVLQPEGTDGNELDFASIDWTDSDDDWIELDDISDESLVSIDLFELHDVNQSELEAYFDNEEWDTEDLEVLLENNEHL